MRSASQTLWAMGLEMTSPERILVTGASGFVGRHLLPALRSAFPRARLIGASDHGEAAEADENWRLDLLEPSSIESCLADTRPDCIVHLAARAAAPAAFAQSLRSAAPEALFLFASSAEAYGLTFQRGGLLDEEAALAPANPYAASKAAADIALGEIALRGLKVVRLRPVNHTGCGQSAVFVVPSFARQIARIEAGIQPPVMRVGALDRQRDFLDVRDVCAAYVAAASRGQDIPPGAAINIASGQPRQIGDILAALVARAGIEIAVETDPDRLRPTDVMTAACDATRAAKLLDWQPQIAWETTLDSVLDDWRGRVKADKDA
jgi:GDP-4-dehydro-6-deoxy-D-mannose reductase